MVVAEVTAGWRGGAREWVGRGRARRARLASSQTELETLARVQESVSRTYPASHGTMSRESCPVPQESSLPPGGALNAWLALHLSPPAGRSLSLRFPLLLLLLWLPPPPVLAADPREPAPGRQPPSLWSGSPRSCVPGLSPLPPLLSSSQASPFCSGAWERGGGSLKTPGECGLG